MISTKTIRYGIYGALLGAIFPLLGMVVMLISNNYRFSLAELFQTQKNDPLLWIIDLAPPILAIMGATIGSRIDLLDQKNAELNTKNQLVEATRQQMEEANARLNQFIYSMSHNLRSPIANFKDIVELVESGIISAEEVKEMLVMLKPNLGRAEETIKDIVGIVMNEKIEPEPRVIDWQNTIEGVFNAVAQANKSRFRLTMKIYAPCAFSSDHLRINSLLDNLITNAIKYADLAKPTSTVHVAVTVSAKSATIEVSDNGTGIAEEYRAKVFNMFFRASVQSMGSGLGLFIVKEIVDKLNGTITLSSEPGMGSTFTLVLPNELVAA
jgi:signal transduction histidine kinase